MKTLVIGLLFCTASMMLNSTPVSAWDFPVSIDITQISFNYSGSIADTLKKDYGTTIITAPEWRKYYGGSPYKYDRFAYTMGSTPTVKAIFSSPDPDPAESIVINVATVSTSSDSGFVNYTGWSLNDATITFPSGPMETEGVFTTQNGTSVKNSVGKCTTKFLWRIYEVGGFVWLQDLGYSTHKYYTLLATPYSFVDNYASPTRYGQPWIEVLDLACRWAKDVAYDTDCVGVLTDSLHFFTEMKYNEDTINYSYTVGSTLKLRNLMQNFSSQDTTLCDCHGYSNFLNVLAYSLGCSNYLFKYKQILENDSIDHKINTKELWPAQWGYSTTTRWGMHQIVFYNNSTYADAATRYSSEKKFVRGSHTWAQYIPLLTNDLVLDGGYGSTIVGSGE